MGERALLRDRHLGGQTCLRRLVVESVALAQPPPLKLGRAVHDDEPAETEVDAGLDEQRRVGHHDRLRAGRRGPPHFFLADAGVHEGVQPRACLRIGEDELAQPLAVHAAVGGQDLAAEGPHHVGMGRPPGGHHIVGDAVEVERGQARLRQAAQDVGLAAGDSAREADPQDEHPRAAFTVFFMRRAIVKGPTPPGTGVRAEATSRTEGACTSPTRT